MKSVVYGFSGFAFFPPRKLSEHAAQAALDRAGAASSDDVAEQAAELFADRLLELIGGDGDPDVARDRDEDDAATSARRRAASVSRADGGELNGGSVSVRSCRRPRRRRS